MYQNVLIATDGSEGTARATRHAVGIADRFDATVHALSVLEEIEKSDQLRSDADAEAERAVEAVVEEGAKSRVEVVTEIRKGMPENEILNYADERDIDLIVMGTHGRTGLDRMIVGSVAEDVLRESPVPVVTVRPTE